MIKTKEQREEQEELIRSAKELLIKDGWLDLNKTIPDGYYLLHTASNEDVDLYWIQWENENPCFWRFKPMGSLEETPKYYKYLDDCMTLSPESFFLVSPTVISPTENSIQAHELLEAYWVRSLYPENYAGEV